MAGVNTSYFAKKFDLANLKSHIDKLDIVKWKSTTIDLSKLGNVVNNDVVKKDVYDELVRKVNELQIYDTSNLMIRFWIYLLS